MTRGVISETLVPRKALHSSFPKVEILGKHAFANVWLHLPLACNDEIKISIEMINSSIELR